ncbi:hypothetical protein ACLBYD_27875 [Rhodococcus sp. C26F]|uniref:Uncharacterized protein n=1 Tax=Rhodococcus rhodochrous TaxID=1829 RepID=A0AAW4XNH7_RHORH|nr:MULTISPECIES: hypothetical protein [Rhodococcus]KLL95961.1 hypothetical protein NJ76_20705 [Rhodococcus sp. IITR03]MCD2114462.1 hypothetical protein [Rhodococcus rhodochrous]QHG82152.1 hypothetical protein D1O33_09460 [Rhodococcus rhodochrous]QOH58174.1 hypothetical protein C6Y44_21060 [Rhodococcus rhodochrous]WAL45786.1 hypothetical protein OQN32_20380 [Rhodococcus pyridinivorans]
MDIATTPPTERRKRALAAVKELGPQRTEKAVVKVRCPKGHTLAAVYKTSEGQVVVSRSGPGGRGNRDREATPHNGTSLNSEFVDTLEATQFEDDEIPSGCACGPRTLSRKKMQDAVASHEHVVNLT